MDTRLAPYQWKLIQVKGDCLSVFLKEWYHRCLSIFYLLPFHTWGTSKVQFLDTTDNFLTYFKWVDADEEFSTCIWISLIEVWDVNFRRVGTQTKTIEELLCSTLCWLGFNHDQQFHTWGIPQLQISDAFKMIKREGGSLNVYIKGRFQLDEIFLAARTEETNAELCRQQSSVEVEYCQK